MQAKPKGNVEEAQILSPGTSSPNLPSLLFIPLMV
jgi:hypothetical protein